MLVTIVVIMVIAVVVVVNCSSCCSCSCSFSCSCSSSIGYNSSNCSSNCSYGVVAVTSNVIRGFFDFLKFTALANVPSHMTLKRSDFLQIPESLLRPHLIMSVFCWVQVD